MLPSSAHGRVFTAHPASGEGTAHSAHSTHQALDLSFRPQPNKFTPGNSAGTSASDRRSCVIARANKKGVSQKVGKRLCAEPTASFYCGHRIKCAALTLATYRQHTAVGGCPPLPASSATHLDALPASSATHLSALRRMVGLAKIAQRSALMVRSSASWPFSFCSRRAGTGRSLTTHAINSLSPSTRETLVACSCLPLTVMVSLPTTL